MRVPRKTPLRVWTSPHMAGIFRRSPAPAPTFAASAGCTRGWTSRRKSSSVGPLWAEPKVGFVGHFLVIAPVIKGVLQLP
jgi:hypothetical protein